MNRSLRKFRNWIFGADVTVYSDHNPLLYVTECASKSAKLMRWALALQEFNVKFKYKPGKATVAADYLSRLGPDGCEYPTSHEQV
jgi:RNase H-like domain found in reverse transcriptase